ncbi:MRC [Mytilus coruscus]|uniref:MRC n=1 Tax=Mytilus coruscus TaxID=42192 RepID=A0A6J8DPB0_MYTCO|nr:MRC [Mytilus coruscus]
MPQYYQLSILVLTGIFISQSTCFVRIAQGQIPRQITGQLILDRDQIEQPQEIFVIEQRGTTGTAPAFLFFPIPLLTMTVSMAGMAMMTMAMMTMMSSDTSSGTSVVVGSAPISVTLPTTQVAAQTTPCVPSCPEGYVLLNDRSASPNCYYFNQMFGITWQNVRDRCATTPGAYLWRPNSEAEANAVRDTFNIPNNEIVWTGAQDSAESGNFAFIIDIGPFSFENPPFGTVSDTDLEDFCVSIRYSTTVTPSIWTWAKQDCNDSPSFVCELPTTLTCQ